MNFASMARAEEALPQISREESHTYGRLSDASSAFVPYGVAGGNDDPTCPIRRHKDRLDLPALVLARFLNRDERAAELAARLACESGYSLTEIYEKLRRGISDYGWRFRGARNPFDDCDERLARFAHRLSVAPAQPREPQVLVLSNGLRGISAALCHMLSDQACPASSMELNSLAENCQGGGGFSRQFPNVHYVIVDNLESSPADVVRDVEVLRRLNLMSANLWAALLTTRLVAAQSPELCGLPFLTLVTELSATLHAAGVPYENPLTPRERAVLDQVADGATNQQAAASMDISIGTVKTYLERAQFKLKSRDRASAVATALRRGWI